MSASGTRERMATAEGVQAVAWEYLSVSLSLDDAARFTFANRRQSSDTQAGWMAADNATSVGPVTYLKSRLMEAGLTGMALAEDDSLPITFATKGRKLVASICSVARSRMFLTPLIVEPIDLVAWRVSGIGGAIK